MKKRNNIKTHLGLKIAISSPTELLKDIDMEVLAVPIGKVSDSISDEFGVSVNIRTVGIKDMTKDEVKSYIVSEIAQNHPIVGGDSEHAVLIVGYKDKGSQLAAIDPNTPSETKTINTDNFIVQAKTGEPWLTTILE